MGWRMTEVCFLSGAGLTGPGTVINGATLEHLDALDVHCVTDEMMYKNICCFISSQAIYIY